MTGLYSSVAVSGNDAQKELPLQFPSGVFATPLSTNPFWTVTLNEMRSIHSIHVVVPQASAPAAFSGMETRVGPNLCADSTFPAPTGVKYVFKCPDPIFESSVTVAKTGASVELELERVFVTIMAPIVTGETKTKSFIQMFRD